VKELALVIESTSVVHGAGAAGKVHGQLPVFVLSSVLRWKVPPASRY
jgi:hypothetical protein